MIRVLLYDDNEQRCQSLQALIGLSDEIELCSAYTNCSNLINNLDDYAPDVILMDIEMPGIDGITAVSMVKRYMPEIRIIMQTVFDDTEKIFAALRAGAEGYILKSANANQILQSIDEVYNGGAYMSPSIALRVMRHFNEDNPDSQYHLTVKEKEVLKLLSDGKSYKMVADALHISYFTVNSHVKKIYEKLQVHSVGEAISLAIKKNLV